MLTESGVNCILLSVDAFHQETIPIHYVKDFAQAILKEGIPIKAHPAWLVSSKDRNPYNLQTLRIVLYCTGNSFSYTFGVLERNGKEWF